MKTITLLITAFLATALVGPVTGAEPASSQNTDAGKNCRHPIRKQFNGTLVAAESFRLLGDPPFGFFVDGAGTATSTQLGQFTWVYTDMVAFSDANPSTVPGRARFIAPNGDNIFSYSDSLQFPTADPNVTNILEFHTITGGTGRFTGATGNFVIYRVVTVANQEVLDGTTAGSFHGTIILKRHP